MDALDNVFFSEVLILHDHENDDCQELDDRHSDRSRGGSELLHQLMISHQNTHAFGPNSIGTFANLPISPRSVVEQHGPMATKPQSSQVQTTHTLRGTAMSPLHSANHLEKENSGYVPTNVCTFTGRRNKCQILILKDSRQRYDGSSCKLRTCLEAWWTIKTRNLRRFVTNGHGACWSVHLCFVRRLQKYANLHMTEESQHWIPRVVFVISIGIRRGEQGGPCKRGRGV